MNIRNRFLAAILSIALAVLLLFGSIAYYISKEAEILKEVAVLHTEIQEIAYALSDQSIDQKIRDDNFKFLVRTHMPHTYIMIMRNKAGDIISDAEILPPISQLSTKLAQIGAPKLFPRSGYLTINGENYPWASAPLQQGNVELLIIHKPKIADTPLIKTVMVRLIIAGLVIIWMAVWAALLLASMISKRIHEHNSELQYRASHDDLTQLPNRALLQQRTEKALTTAALQNQSLALLVMDLDRFKEINDTLGHHTGDKLLLQLGRRISATLRESDTVARLGGDEFALLLPNTDAEKAVACVERISQLLDKPFNINQMKITTTSSIGIAMFPQHGKDLESLLKYADIAMYQAKQNNTGFSIYDEEHDSYTIQRFTLARELRQAIDEHQLVLYYQPKIDIPTGRINGVEALVRWQHPTHGLIPPDKFIGIAEQNGLIDSLTYSVIEAAIIQCCEWRKSGINLKTAINLSARNLHNTSLPKWIEDKLNQYNLPAGMLELELTENAVMHDVNCASTIFKQLSKLGIPLSIDDFGTGMSSLSYLTSLPVSKLKIDRSFVMDLNTNKNNEVIVRSTIDLAHNLGYQVIAEGVETIEALNLLKKLSCDCAQGYFFTPPLPASKLEAWLKDNDWEILTSPATSSHSKLNFN